MRVTLVLASACTVLVLVGAGRESSAIGGKKPSGSVTTTESVVSDSHASTLRPPEPGAEWQPSNSEAAPLYNLNWYSVNGGGATNVTGTNFRLGLSVGQSAAGFVSGVNYKLGVGFWYGAASAACPVALSGDVTNNGTITTADIIALVNYVLKSGLPPVLCIAVGDINCSGTITTADIIALVNFVLKSGLPPCNICNYIPVPWSCP